MGSFNTGTAQAKILIIALVLTCISVPFLIHLPGFTPVYLLFFAAGAAFIGLHWWMLASAIESFFNGEKMNTAVRGMASVFPAAIALSIVFIAGKTDRLLMLPAASGIVVLPVAATLFGIYEGITRLFLARKD